jgi:hypothetical protein
MMEAVSSSQTSVLTRATLRNIPEYGIRQIQLSSTFKFFFSEDSLYLVLPQRQIRQPALKKNISPSSEFSSVKENGI